MSEASDTHIFFVCESKLERKHLHPNAVKLAAFLTQCSS
jgi:hypothetical protein